MGFSIPSTFTLVGVRTGTFCTAGAAASSTPIRVLLAIAPVALPTVYLLVLNHTLSKRTLTGTKISPPDPLPSPFLPLTGAGAGDSAIPAAVLAAAPQLVIARERVLSHAVFVADLRPEFAAEEDLDGLLEAYLAAAMQAFSWTPQALLLARLYAAALPDPDAFRESFEAPYLRACAFRPGDRVCGVYVVRARREGRAVLDLSPPKGWKGPLVKGALEVGFERAAGEDSEQVRFVNETVLWRRKDESATVLEGRVGRWLHKLMACWLVVRGVEAVMDGRARGGS